jgi:multidrug efflux pump subunit AcrB
MRRAEELAWNRIGAIRSELPPEVQLTVEQMTPSIFPILSLVLTGGDNSAQLREYAFYELAPQIKTIPDVLYANVAGGDLREIEVETRPNDLLAVGLSAADVADQISKGHRLQPVGRIEHPPFAFQLLVNTQAESAAQIEELVIATKNNQPLRVRDVADVKVLHQDRVLSIGFEQKDAVVITVFRRLGGNTLNISHDLHALIAKLPPSNRQATIVYDQAQFVETAVDNVRDAIIIGGLFSVLILLAFLRSWRATLISALAIPTTLAITFLFLRWIGETLNLMSLGGLAVAIGLIIDDTVVVIENIARHLAPDSRTPTSAPSETVRSGDPDPINAASGEITGAVIGSTLTTVLVFLPLAFIVGVYGQFFASLSWSLAIAVLVSMVISLTLVPVLAAKFLAGRPMPAPGPIYRGIAHVYELVLAAALSVPWLTLGISLGAVGVGIILYTGIPSFWKTQKPGQGPPEPLVRGLQTGLMPAMDEGSFIIDYWTPSGTPLDRTEKILEEVEHILLENPDVHSYVRRTGSENGIFATQSNRGDIQVVLRPAEEGLVSRLRKPVRPENIDDELKRIGKEGVQRKYRRRPIKNVMEEVKGDVKERFAEHQLRIELVQIMQDELNDLSGASKPVEVKLFGPDYAKLRGLAEQLGDALEANGKGHGIGDVNNNVHEGNPDLMIKIDAVKQTRLRLTPQEVERQMTAIYLGQVATQVRESAARITNVRVRYPDNLRFGKKSFSADSILNQMVFIPDAALSPVGPSQDYSTPLVGLGRAVTLGSVATIQAVRTPEEQWRENQQPAIFVTAEQDEEEGGLDEMVKVVQQEMNKIVLPSGYHWALGGHYIRQQEAFRSLLIVMIVAVFLVFIMLAFQFRSVFLPMLIFMTQPLSLLAGFFALWVTNTPLNISSAMGVILLIGLDMKNGILLVEYIQQLRKEGMELRPALLLAGRTRFRPILMTSLAAILGLFPLALGIGPGAQMQQPLAIMVIGGLTANMLFTRLIIPVGYLLMERSKGKGSQDLSPKPA